MVGHKNREIKVEAVKAKPKPKKVKKAKVVVDEE